MFFFLLLKKGFSDVDWMDLLDFSLWNKHGYCTFWHVIYVKFRKQISRQTILSRLGFEPVPSGVSAVVATTEPRIQSSSVAHIYLGNV